MPRLKWMNVRNWDYLVSNKMEWHQMNTVRFAVKSALKEKFVSAS